jgi:hypothetical protein
VTGDLLATVLQRCAAVRQDLATVSYRCASLRKRLAAMLLGITQRREGLAAPGVRLERRPRQQCFAVRTRRLSGLELRSVTVRQCLAIRHPAG